METCREITKAHVISVNSNFTHEMVQDFLRDVPPERVLEITASLHYLELEYRGLFEKYLRNFIEARDRGFNIRCEQPAFPPLISKVDDIREKLGKEGIQIQFVPYIGTYSDLKYPYSYSKHERDLFNLEEFRQDYNFHGKPCNAGYNACIVTSNGDMFRCSDVHKKIGNIYEGFELFQDQGACPVKFCNCPLRDYDRVLFQKYLSERIGL